MSFKLRITLVALILTMVFTATNLCLAQSVGGNSYNFV